MLHFDIWMAASVESLPVLRRAAITEPRSAPTQTRELATASTEQPEPDEMESEPVQTRVNTSLCRMYQYGFIMTLRLGAW